MNAQITRADHRDKHRSTIAAFHIHSYRGLFVDEFCLVAAGHSSETNNSFLVVAHRSHRK